MKNKLLLIALLLTALQLPAQSVYQIFRGTRVVNGHSVQTLNEGEMEFIIGHRFGRLNGGFYELFGLDQSNIRLGLDYGIKPWINIGLGRSSLGKEFDGFVKLRFFSQCQDGSGMPFALTGFSSTAYSSLKEADPQKPLAIQNRLAFTHQLLLARKFSDRLSL
ncbi:MAG: hypothetical protein KDC44_17875, partial [Phaeodactylibacter sp.]|nr:hypothetical protein [Phaeodactylibacter sp.]